MLHIGHILPSSFPPQLYGGTERVVAGLCKAQKIQGLRASVSCKSMISLFEHAEVTDKVDFNSSALLAWKEAQNIDLLHFHSLPSKDLDLSGVPHVVTIHGNAKEGEEFPVNSIFVSKNHAERNQSDCYVHNSIDLDVFRYASKTFREHARAAFLAKAGWRVKNLRGAIELCQKSSLGLNVIGGRRPLKLWALLKPSVKFFGMLDDERKIATLNDSDLFVFPVLWHEPFGIAVIEALALGLPVASTAFGSLPEIVSQEVGLCSNDEEEWIDFLKGGFRKINPDECRHRVEKLFHLQIMAEKYLGYYKKVVDGKSLNPAPPRSLKDTQTVFEIK